MAGWIGLSIVHILAPRWVANKPQQQALLENLTYPSRTISEGDGNNKDDTTATNIHSTRYLGRGFSSVVMDEEG